MLKSKKKSKKASKAPTRKKAKSKKTKSSSVKEENAIHSILTKIHVNARRRASRKDASFTIIHEGKIIKVYPKGSKKTIGTVEKRLEGGKKNKLVGRGPFNL